MTLERDTLRIARYLEPVNPDNAEDATAVYGEKGTQGVMLLDYWVDSRSYGPWWWRRKLWYVESHRVSIGPFRTRAQAELMAAECRMLLWDEMS